MKENRKENWFVCCLVRRGVNKIFGWDPGIFHLGLHKTCLSEMERKQAYCPKYVCGPLTLFQDRTLTPNSYIDIIFCPPSICMPDPKIPKILSFLHGVAETSRLTLHTPFRHWNTRSAFPSQIDQNAPSQPRVDQNSNEVKVHPKHHFHAFTTNPSHSEILSILTRR